MDYVTSYFNRYLYKPPLNPTITMAVRQSRSRTKPSGGIMNKQRESRLHSLGRIPSLTKLGKMLRNVIRTRGGNQKERLIRVEVANVLDQKSGKFKQSKIVTVAQNPANRHHERRNIMSKGTIIETEMGKAKVTSRPGQDGTVNAILVQ